ncbi:MAG: hypothetical protein U1E45_08960 [Geminicoccaceae bacterium]
MRRLVLGALLLAAAPGARAEIFASPPTFQAGQTSIDCAITNGGASAVTLSGAKVTAEVGPTFDLPLAGNTCPSKLQPGSYCHWQALLRTGGAHVCRITVSSRTNLRGRMEIGAGNDTLVMEEMR